EPPVRRSREDVAADRISQAPRRRAVFLADVARAVQPLEQGEGAPTSDQRRIVVAHGVVQHPAPEQNGRSGEGRPGPGEPETPSAPGDEGEKPACEQDDVRGANEHENRRAEADSSEAPRRGAADGPYGEQRPEREAAGEDGIARRLVEEGGVGRV